MAKRAPKKKEVVHDPSNQPPSLLALLGNPSQLSAAALLQPLTWTRPIIDPQITTNGQRKIARGNYWKVNLHQSRWWEGARTPWRRTYYDITPENPMYPEALFENSTAYDLHTALHKIQASYGRADDWWTLHHQIIAFTDGRQRYNSNWWVDTANFGIFRNLYTRDPKDDDQPPTPFKIALFSTPTAAWPKHCDTQNTDREHWSQHPHHMWGAVWGKPNNSTGGHHLFIWDSNAETIVNGRELMYRDDLKANQRTLIESIKKSRRVIDQVWYGGHGNKEPGICTQLTFDWLQRLLHRNLSSNDPAILLVDTKWHNIIHTRNRTDPSKRLPPAVRKANAAAAAAARTQRTTRSKSQSSSQSSSAPGPAPKSPEPQPGPAPKSPEPQPDQDPDATSAEDSDQDTSSAEESDQDTSSAEESEYETDNNGAPATEPSSPSADMAISQQLQLSPAPRDNSPSASLLTLHSATTSPAPGPAPKDRSSSVPTLTKTSPVPELITKERSASAPNLSSTTAAPAPVTQDLQTPAQPENTTATLPIRTTEPAQMPTIAQWDPVNKPAPIDPTQLVPAKRKPTAAEEERRQKKRRVQKSNMERRAATSSSAQPPPPVTASKGKGKGKAPAKPRKKKPAKGKEPARDTTKGKGKGKEPAH